MYVLIECSNLHAPGELNFVKMSSSPADLRQYARRMHAGWLAARVAGLRAGGAQLLIAPDTRVVVDAEGIKVVWAACECPVDDTTAYEDWCRVHGVSPSDEERGAAFH